MYENGRNVYGGKWFVFPQLQKLYKTVCVRNVSNQHKKFKLNDTFFTVALKGWTIESLQHWGQFTMLAITGILMLCIEWWSFELGTFLMGE